MSRVIGFLSAGSKKQNVSDSSIILPSAGESTTLHLHNDVVGERSKED